MKSHSSTYTCPMHADVRKGSAGTCPKCGMQLVPVNDKQVPGATGQRGKVTEGTHQEPPR